MVKLIIILLTLFELSANAQMSTAACRRKPYYVPTIVSNLTHWWKADSYDQANETRLGGAGQEWIDHIGGSTYYGRQGTAGNKPTFRVNVAAGLPGVFFTNKNDFSVQQYFDVSNGSSANKVILTGDYTIIAAIHPQGDTGFYKGGCIIGDAYVRGGVVDETVDMYADNGTNNIVVNSLATDENLTLSVGFESASGTTTLYRNNNSQSSQSLTGTKFSFIGASANIGGVTTAHVRYGGYIHEILVYDRALTLNERAILQKYFARWGIR